MFWTITKDNFTDEEREEYFYGKNGGEDLPRVPHSVSV